MVNTPPNMETAPAGSFLPLAVLLALGLINTDSSSSVDRKRKEKITSSCQASRSFKDNNTTAITSYRIYRPSFDGSFSSVSSGFSSANKSSCRWTQSLELSTELIR